MILYFHGGSYLYGSSKTHADIVARLALAASVRAVAIDYRLAPEHRHPAQLEDALASYRALAREHGAKNIVLAGDSAGGNLALALLLTLRDAKEEQPAGAVLISPWCDLAARRASTRTNDATDWGTREMVLQQARDFAGDLALEDPRLSLVDADLAGLQPILIQVGGAERLLDECRDTAERAKDAGVDVTLDVLPEMPHDGAIFAGYHPTGAKAVETLGAWIRGRLAS